MEILFVILAVVLIILIGVMISYISILNDRLKYLNLLMEEMAFEKDSNKKVPVKSRQQDIDITMRGWGI